ncbi:spore coat associated protein CotJA [Cohnella thailandensis]|jgi:Spore coat associated protein JA (CotJA).|uniref:Spore coat associated protein CotJA n=1 Tax=Cohnella thailandensis TaxID=557557 RepID=A0A841SRK7_9BACL|nr:spore coat associated protein CotJA [Cohnella thailandensis]MBB6633842.1 spore coat associated protein CotJA [Cohnella thailandensis]MBP1972525.1 spore coat protein JA [Cohnella thailandensis]
MYDNQWREWKPYVSPLDPCPPMRIKRYVVPPNQYIPFQPMNLPQFPLNEALFRGTLWPALYSPYPSRRATKGG